MRPASVCTLHPGEALAGGADDGVPSGRSRGPRKNSVVVTSVIFISGGYESPRGHEHKVVVTGASGRVGRAVLASWPSWPAGTTECGPSAAPSLPRGAPGAPCWWTSQTPDRSTAPWPGRTPVIHLGAYPSTAQHRASRSSPITPRPRHTSRPLRGAGDPAGGHASSITYGLEEQTRQGKVQALPLDRVLGPAPDDFYALSKWVGEEIFTLGAQEHGLHVASLRIALVVGPDKYPSGKPPAGSGTPRPACGPIDSRDVPDAPGWLCWSWTARERAAHPLHVGAEDCSQ